MKTLLLSILLFASLHANGLTYDTSKSLLWQDNDDVIKEVRTYQEALNYCENLKIEDYNDFTLPTIQELQSIINYKNYNPAIMKGFMKVKSEEYWSSTPFVYNENSSWTIDFKRGTREPTFHSYSRYVRCVQHIK